MTSILKDVMEHGTGKTGTTTDYQDAWFVGYSPQLVMGSWFGYDTDKTMENHMTGALVAGLYWKQSARSLYKKRPVRLFPVPPGIQYATVDPSSGALAIAYCPKTRRMAFRTGRQPVRPCSLHGPGSSRNPSRVTTKP